MSNSTSKASAQLLSNPPLVVSLASALLLLRLDSFAYSRAARRHWVARELAVNCRVRLGGNLGSLDGNFKPLRDCPGFDEWKAAVNREVERKVGIGADCLPDYDYRNAWDAGVDAKECALEAIQAAMDF